jgi:hypothetical protein
MTIRKMLLGTAAAMLIATQVMCVSIANASEAMSGLEFLKIDSSRDDKDIKKEVAVTKSFVVQFVAQGYRNIPDWALLANMMSELIRKNGYRDKDISEIAEEAAIAYGMRK